MQALDPVVCTCMRRKLEELEELEEKAKVSGLSNGVSLQHQCIPIQHQP